MQVFRFVSYVVNKICIVLSVWNVLIKSEKCVLIKMGFADNYGFFYPPASAVTVTVPCHEGLDNIMPASAFGNIHIRCFLDQDVGNLYV